MGFEEDMKRLEEIAGQLRSNERSLDEAIALFEEGVRIARRIEKSLSEMERKIEILLTPPDSDEEASLAPFPGGQQE